MKKSMACFALAAATAWGWFMWHCEHVLAQAAFQPGATYQTCFTPQDDCESMIVGAIGAAQQQILVQAYSFTSRRIAAALVSAKQRGLDVAVLLDDGQRTDRYSQASTLRKANIPILVDDGTSNGHAHSKVMVLDNAVLTGSYNFSASAQRRNNENIILIKGDDRLTAQFTANWKARREVSRPY